jgi:hypothetical protein
MANGDPARKWVHGMFPVQENVTPAADGEELRRRGRRGELRSGGACKRRSDRVRAQIGRGKEVGGGGAVN